MSTTDQLFSRVREGEIVHLRRSARFKPLFEMLSQRFESTIGLQQPFSTAFSELDAGKFQVALDAVVKALDASGAHFRMLAEILSDDGISSDEGMLMITLDKSLRYCLTGRAKKNYGYFVHRDSWFDLAPDGINVVLYMNDVPYHGNTAFFIDAFGVEVPFDPSTRRLLSDDMLSRVTSFNCRAGDVLIFSGDHLHGGALVEVDRLSIEFRFSRQWNYGRKDQGIYYKSVERIAGG